jgi:hypothetical protein
VNTTTAFGVKKKQTHTQARTKFVFEKSRSFAFLSSAALLMFVLMRGFLLVVVHKKKVPSRSL